MGPTADIRETKKRLRAMNEWVNAWMDGDNGFKWFLNRT